MPVPRRPVDSAPSSFDEVSLGYSRASARAEAARSRSSDLEAARAACPFGVDVAGMVRAIADDDFDGALATVLRAHQWPGILGRTCKAYCERAAQPLSSAAGVDPLALKELERAAATFGRSAPSALGAATTGRTVAVVGAGSAGAATARRLRELGHSVVVYDRLPTVGGMMAVGYPEFRLPRDVVNRDLRFDAWGVEVRCGVPVDRPLLLRLMRDHDAVVVTAGQCEGVRLDVPGRDLDGVYDALGFLTAFRLGQLAHAPRQAVVVGGGYTAHDVCRTLRRMGCQVRMVCRRGESQLRVRPAARPTYLAVLRAEGIPVSFWTAVTDVVGSGRVSAVHCSPTRPGPHDGAGAPTAFVMPGISTTIECDTVVAALGERADLGFLPLEVRTESGRIAVDDQHMTSVLGLFAAGEIAAGPSGTDHAFLTGRAAAEAVDRFLDHPQVGE